MQALPLNSSGSTSSERACGDDPHCWATTNKIWVTPSQVCSLQVAADLCAGKDLRSCLSVDEVTFRHARDIPGSLKETEDYALSYLQEVHDLEKTQEDKERERCANVNRDAQKNYYESNCHKVQTIGRSCSQPISGLNWRGDFVTTQTCIENPVIEVCDNNQKEINAAIMAKHCTPTREAN
jgi:hypothetical protein